jgi:hypothetical protein
MPRSQGWFPAVTLLQITDMLLQMWSHTIVAHPALVLRAVSALQPLLQQLQQCSTLLPQIRLCTCTEETAAAAAAPARFSADGHIVGCTCVVTRLYCNATMEAGMLFHRLSKPLSAAGPGVAAQVHNLMCEPTTLELLLQLLTVCAVQLHQHYEALQQQQQQQQQHVTHEERSSSDHSYSQMQQRSQSSRQHRPALLFIPGYYQDMLQLLPGRKAYFDAAAAGYATDGADLSLEGLMDLAAGFSAALTDSLNCITQSVQGLGATSGNAALSAAAVRLVLQLQLLAAQFARYSLRESSNKDARQKAEGLLFTVNALLQTQIEAFVRTTGSSCLPPEVLQQAGLQLLQALAAPLQQLQLGGARNFVAKDQLYTLRAAAAGLGASSGGQAFVWLSFHSALH